MSLRKARARFVPSEDVGPVQVVEVFGETLTDDFSEIEVSDEVFEKLKGNPHIELQVPRVEAGNSPAALFDHDGDGKPGGSKPRARAQSAEPQD